MPIGWDDLKGLKRADEFTIVNTLEHINKRGRDPWAGYAPVDISGLLRGMGAK